MGGPGSGRRPGPNSKPRDRLTVLAAEHWREAKKRTIEALRRTKPVEEINTQPGEVVPGLLREHCQTFVRETLAIRRQGVLDLHKPRKYVKHKPKKVSHK